MPISVIPSAIGTSKPAVQNTDFLATCPSLAEKMREYMSGPTTYVSPTSKSKLINWITSNLLLVGKEK